MERRLILVPQRRVQCRYQEWWPSDLVENLVTKGPFDSCVILGNELPVLVSDDWSQFSPWKQSVLMEARQLAEYHDLEFGEGDVLLHCDLSFPGLFHTALLNHRPPRAFAFCHASAKNTMDFWSEVSREKWKLEEVHAGLYDEVLVATRYHAMKLGWRNARPMGALPSPPEWIQPPRQKSERPILMTSVARPHPQKVNMEVEEELEQIRGERIIRCQASSFNEYFSLLDDTMFVIITAQEETYGYQAVDAVTRGAFPIAPRSYSYPEILPGDLLYNNRVSKEQQAQEISDIIDRVSQQVEETGREPRLNNTQEIDSFYERLGKLLTGRRDQESVAPHRREP